MHEKLHLAQEKGYDCGSTIVASVLRFKKIKYDYEKLMLSLGTTEDQGTLSTSIVQVLKAYKITAKIIENSSIETLREHFNNGRICVPMYQNWSIGEKLSPDLDYGHYAFIKKITRNYVTVIDPAINKNSGYGFGKWRYSVKEFKRVWVDVENGLVMRNCFISINI